MLTLSFGSGHVRAAQAIAQALRQQSPTAAVRIVDVLERCRWLFRAGYVWPYWLMVRHRPSLWGYYFASRVDRKAQATAPEWAFRWGCPKALEAIAEFEPEVIVAAEVAACEVAVLARRSSLTRARIINVITDHAAEPVWVKPEVDAFATPDDRVREQLIGWGAPAESVVVCGIPTDRSFTVKHSPKATRARFGLGNDGVPIVLLMGGGMGPCRMDCVANSLSASGMAMRIVAVAGNDAHARRRLNNLSVKPPMSLSVIAWTEEVAALMQAASLLVTKPGGLTAAEAALCGLPMVVFDVIPGPEQHNAAHLTEAGGAVIASNAHQAADEALALLCDLDKRRMMSRRMREIARPDAASKIASLTLNGEILPRVTAIGRAV